MPFRVQKATCKRISNSKPCKSIQVLFGCLSMKITYRHISCRTPGSRMAVLKSTWAPRFPRFSTTVLVCTSYQLVELQLARLLITIKMQKHASIPIVTVKLRESQAFMCFQLKTWQLKLTIVEYHKKESWAKRNSNTVYSMKAHRQKWDLKSLQDNTTLVSTNQQPRLARRSLALPSKNENLLKRMRC